MDISFSDLCSKAANDSIEIIKLKTKRQDIKYYFDELNNLIESSSEINQIDKHPISDNLFIIKFNLNTHTTCCRLCNQLHPISSEFCQFDRRLSLIDSINHKTNSKMNYLSTITRTSSFGNAYPQFDPIKSLIDKMKNFQLMSLNFESQVKKSYDLIKKKVNGYFQNNLLKDLNETYSKMAKELENFETNCILNVDKSSQYWKELENLINVNKLDPETIKYYLNEENIDTSESINTLIEEFSKLIDSKLKEFNSYILMNKKVILKQNPDFKIDETSLGLLNLTQLQTNSSYSEDNFQELFHLNEIIDEKKTKLKIISHLDMTERIHFDQKNFKYVSVYPLDSVDCLVLCIRYGNSSSNDIYTDFYMINCDGIITKSLNLNNGIVRCIDTNSTHILFTLERDQNELNKNFELNLYDSELNMVKCLKVVDTNHLVEKNSTQIFPVSIFLNDEKIFIFKNTIPFINVYDMDLNLLTILGQDINSSYKYFIKPTHNFMCIKSSFLYTSQVTARGTTVTVLDLNTGFNFSEFEIENYFTNFYVLSQSKIKNEILFLCSSVKKMIVYDLKSKKSVFSASLCDPNDCITSFCLNKFGFLITVLSNSFKIDVF